MSTIFIAFSRMRCDILNMKKLGKVNIMTARRPHWDDDLIESVKNCDYEEIGTLSTQTAYNVISAVEAWIEQQPITQSPQVAEADEWRSRMEKAEAQLQAVREALISTGNDFNAGVLSRVRDVMRTWDGTGHAS